MEAYQERVIEERNALQEKLEKLTSFFGTSLYHNLPQYQREMLDKQHAHMASYRNVLNERIGTFM